MKISELSFLTGIPDNTLYSLQNRGTIPKSGEPKDYIRAIIAHLQGQIDKKARSKPKIDDLTREQIRLTAARADEKELDNFERAGNLLKADEVLQSWEKVIAACKSRLLAIPSKVAFEVSQQNNPLKIQKRIEEEICLALDELAALVLDEDKGD